MKQKLAIILAIVMIAVMAVPAYAAGPNEGTLTYVGSWDSPVSNGTWKYEAETDTWSYAIGGKLITSTWGYIKNPYAEGDQHDADWFYFDSAGKMLTGWYWIKGIDGIIRCYWLNPISDNTMGACLIGPAVTPDGHEVNVDGAWTVNGVTQTREVNIDIATQQDTATGEKVVGPQ